MIAAAEQIRLPEFRDYCFVGELALDGSVNGILPITIEARRRGRKAIVVRAGPGKWSQGDR